jgi:Tfp pilus assembly protein PilO
MLITIILFICALGAFFLWRKSCAALEMVEADGKKVRDAYFPVSRAEDKLKPPCVRI